MCQCQEESKEIARLCEAQRRGEPLSHEQELKLAQRDQVYSELEALKGQLRQLLRPSVQEQAWQPPADQPPTPGPARKLPEGGARASAPSGCRELAKKEDQAIAAGQGWWECPQTRFQARMAYHLENGLANDAPAEGLLQTLQSEVQEYSGQLQRAAAVRKKEELKLAVLRKEALLAQQLLYLKKAVIAEGVRVQELKAEFEACVDQAEQMHGAPETAEDCEEQLRAARAIREAKEKQLRDSQAAKEEADKLLSLKSQLIAERSLTLRLEAEGAAAQTAINEALWLDVSKEVAKCVAKSRAPPPP